MTIESDLARRQQLGEFLRSQRARLLPGLFGLQGGVRRRTPGLRREEVAQLGGLSTTWYTWLEQGRDISLSAHALGRLANVLRFSAAERAYLFDLAGKRDPQASSEAEPEAPAALLTAIETISALPMCLITSGMPSAGTGRRRRFSPGWLDGENDRNLLHFIFLNPVARRLIDGWESRARGKLPSFVSTTAINLEESAMQALVQTLIARVVFCRGRPIHSVVGREGGLRRFNHPRLGLVELQQITFNPTTRPDLKFVMLV